MPSTEKLKKYLEQLCPIPDKDWAHFSSMLQRRVFDRKQLVIRAGEVENFSPQEQAAGGLVEIFGGATV